jgi:hypothetical protein
VFAIPSNSHSHFHTLSTPYPHQKILFENRKSGDVGNDCSLPVDGTDFRVAKSYERPYYSYKFKKSGIQYKVALCIKTGDICWLVGPYLPGIWNDNMIFQDGLVNYLEAGERCEADDGYRGSAPLYAKCHGVIEANPDKAGMQQRLRNRQETVNKWFKNWAILSNLFRHKLPEHQTVFGAIVVLAQLYFTENPLFQIDYNDL